MKKLFTFSLIALMAIGASVTDVNAQMLRKGQIKSELSKKKTIKKQKLVWSEEFNDNQIDGSKWSKVTRSNSHWSRYMSNEEDLVTFEDGSVVLKGRINKDLAADSSKYVTGGLWTKGKFGMGEGRIDIRAKLGEAKGAWPALWLVPFESGVQWPYGGEIDIMEHLNNDEFVYQTTHTNYTYNLKNTSDPYNFAMPKFNKGEYNVFSVAWNEDGIQWFLNGKPTFYYPRVEKDEVAAQGQFPYKDTWAIILSQQLGGPGTWVGEITDEDLPVDMWIDWVRVYEYED